jgi:hypothetical protein
VNPDNANQSVTVDNSAGGGVFSSDGIHPLPTGYALIAERFIEMIKKQAGGWGGIPQAKLAALQARDPYDTIANHDPLNPKKPT